MKLLDNALFIVIFEFVLISITLAQDIAADSCSQYSLGLCIRCVIGTHLYNGLCYNNILGCLNYAQGGVCSSCEAPNFQLSGNTCILTEGAKIIEDFKTNLYKYGGNIRDPGANFGEAGFIPTTFEAVRTWPTFISLNTFIRAGTYAHFISRTSNPVYSVHYYIQNNIYSYKILYDGSGGGLFLCIGDVLPNFQVRLRSLTPISASSITDKCVDYDVNIRCLRCASGYHLQNNKCYENFGGCVLYRQNICLRCLDYFFLVQNRCISDCLSVSDARSIFYYNGSKLQSTFQAFYQVSSSQFYNVEIKNTATPVPTTITTSVPIILSTNIETRTSKTPVFNTLNDSRSASTQTVSNLNSGSPIIIGGNSNNVNNIITFNRTTATISSTSSKNLPLQAPQISFNQSTISQTSGDISILNTTDIQIDSNMDPNCAAFDNNKKCTKCTPYFYQNKETGRCTAANPFCGTYSEDDGQCLTCFSGFKLQKGDCFIAW